MSRDAFLTCVYYYCLPEFPKNCAIVKDNSLFIRDILVCNPNNLHVNYGGQYDPHYEHKSAPEFKMCWLETRRKIMSIISNDLYDNIYLLFRTSKILLSKSYTQCVSGFYDIDLDKVSIDPEYEEPVLYAKDAKFVNLNDAIGLSDFFAGYRNRRFPFSNETRNGTLQKYLISWLRRMKKAENLLDGYIDMTDQLNEVFKYHEYEDGIYPICDGCDGIANCYLIKRIHKKGKLYHQLPVNIALRINEHYKNTIKLS